MQTPFDRNVWPVAGSTSYYALLHCPDRAVGNVWTTLELIASISEALASVSEPAVAEQKVHWWHEELARLAKGQARHPRSQAFQNNMVATFGTVKPIEKWLPDMLTVLSCNTNERFSNAATETLFKQRIEDDYSARLRLMARALQAPDQLDSSDCILQPELVTQDLVTGLGLFDRLRRFHKLQAGGGMVWPDSWYAEHGLQPENLYDADKTPQLMQLFATATGSATTALEKALSSVWQLQRLTQEKRSELQAPSTVFITAASLRLAQLAKWQRRQPDLLREYQSLTPLRKSLVTWRTQRKLALLQKRLHQH